MWDRDSQPCVWLGETLDIIHDYLAGSGVGRLPITTTKLQSASVESLLGEKRDKSGSFCFASIAIQIKETPISSESTIIETRFS
jgi:hypothetical protein